MGNSGAFKKGHKIKNTGRTRFQKGENNIAKREDIRKKISLSRIGIGHPHTEETRKRMSASHTGVKRQPHSLETKRKMSLAKIGYQPMDHWLNIPDRSGGNNPNWRGGKSYEPYSVDWTKTLKRSIRERDKYQCQWCGDSQGEETLSVHHIDYDKKNCDPCNLISLCHKCHAKTNYNRDFWEKYFMGLIL